MRILSVIALATLVSACANQAPAPSKPETAAAPAEKKGPQCWNGDMSTFQDVGSKASISGVAVECKPTGDGKSAQWMSNKH